MLKDSIFMKIYDSSPDKRLWRLINKATHASRIWLLKDGDDYIKSEVEHGITGIALFSDVDFALIYADACELQAKPEVMDINTFLKEIENGVFAEEKRFMVMPTHWDVSITDADDLYEVLKEIQENRENEALQNESITRRNLSEKMITGIYNSPVHKRYRHFIGKTADEASVWLLKSGTEFVRHTTENGNNGYALFSAMEFAVYYAGEQNFLAEPFQMNVHEFLTRCEETRDAFSEETCFMVMPTKRNECIITIEELYFDLQEELERVEGI